MNDEERAAARRIFDQIDYDRSGTVDFEELGALVKNIEERRTMMNILDTGHCAAVTNEEWLSYLATTKLKEGEEWFRNFLLYIEKVAGKAVASAQAQAGERGEAPEAEERNAVDGGGDEATAQPFVGSPRSLSGLRSGTTRADKLEAIFGWIAGLQVNKGPCLLFLCYSLYNAFGWIAGLQAPYGTIDIHTLHQVALLKSEINPKKRQVELPIIHPRPPLFFQLFLDNPSPPTVVFSSSGACSSLTAAYGASVDRGQDHVSCSQDAGMQRNHR